MRGRRAARHTPGICWFFMDNTTTPSRFTCREHGTTLGDLFNAKDLPEQCRKARAQRDLANGGEVLMPHNDGTCGYSCQQCEEPCDGSPDARSHRCQAHRNEVEGGKA